MEWTVETLNATVRAEIAALPADMRARLTRISALIVTAGLENVHEPYIKHIDGPIWEMRMKGKDGISRALYVVVRLKRVVILRVFIKKTNKTPRKEIEIALARVQEVSAETE